MNKKASYQKLFKEILDEKAFHRAEEYNKDVVIEHLNAKEKTLLAKILFQLAQILT